MLRALDVTRAVKDEERYPARDYRIGVLLHGRLSRTRVPRVEGLPIPQDDIPTTDTVEEGRPTGYPHARCFPLHFFLFGVGRPFCKPRTDSLPVRWIDCPLASLRVLFLLTTSADRTRRRNPLG